jgi:hypothetical protein
MGGPCNKYGGEDRIKVYTGFWWGDLREGNHLDGPAVFGCMILKIDLQEKEWRGGGGLDWIDVAQDRKSWQAFVSAVIDLRVP